MRPFSNGTEYLIWQETNCYNCKKYNDDWLTKEGCLCELNYWLTHGIASGEIPANIAKRISGSERRIGLKCNEREAK